MGWNRGYEILESTVVTLYNHKVQDIRVLNKELLNKIMQPFVGTDVDHGGEQGLLADDGLTADEIVIKIMQPEEFAELPPKETCKRGDCGDCGGDGRSCKVSELWDKITRENWQFW